MNLLERIDNIELKVRQLAQRLERTKRENTDLQLENESLKAELDRQHGITKVLNDKLEQAQRALGSTQEEQPEHAEQLKHQLDQYIEELNKCIAWLHKQ